MKFETLDQLPFDPDWYRATYNLEDYDEDLLEHFCREGWTRLYDPAPDFNTVWYLVQTSEILSASKNPDALFPRQISIQHEFPITDAEHQICQIARQILELDLFEYDWYLENNEDVAEQELSPLYHLIEFGLAEERSPGPNFAADWYRLRYLEGTANETTPALLDYLSRIDGAEPPVDELELVPVNKEQHEDLQRVLDSEAFDPDYYLQLYPDCDLTEHSVVAHYTELGWKLGYNPSSRFDTNYYLICYEDVVNSGVCPLLHFLKFGHEEARQPKYLKDEIASFPEHYPATRKKLLDPTSIQPPRSGGWMILARAALAPVETDADGNHAPADEAPLDGYPVKVFDEPTSLIGGTHFILTKSGQVLSNELFETVGNSRYSIKSPHIRWDGNPDQPPAIFLRYRRENGRFLKTGINFMHEYDANYFHFMVEVLPKLAIAQAHGISPSCPIIISKDLHKNLRALLDLANVEQRPVIELPNQQLCRVDQLINIDCGSKILDVYAEEMSADDIHIAHGPLRAIRNQVMSQIAPDKGAKPARKIYLRRGSRMRKIVNEEHLEESLLAAGFEIVSPEELSLESQIDVFSSAQTIVSPTGAGLTNVIWCNPGAHVIVLKSDHPNINLVFWQELCRLAELRLTELSGPRAYVADEKYAVHDDYFIAPEAVLGALNTPFEEASS